jgi:hypothetical protein
MHVIARMAGNCDDPGLDRVTELTMAAAGSDDFSAVLLQSF